MKRVILAAAVAVLASQLGSSVVVDARQQPPLQFFKNYFVTGDYVVGGVGVNGNGNGTIVIGDVPEEDDVDIVAAFLYWQVVDKNNVGPVPGALGVTFRGHTLNNTDGAFGKLLTNGTPACSSGGGGSSGSGMTYGYRADVLAYLDVEEPPPAGSGKTVGNGSYPVHLPNGQGLDALGASLVLVFRKTSLEQLSAVVFYDGAYTMNTSSSVGMSLSIGGFYDAGGLVDPSAKITHIVGGGQSNPSEVLHVDGGTPDVTNPFAAARAAQWDNYTRTGLTTPTSDVVNTSVNQGPGGASTWGCLTWAAVVYRTTVDDADVDGLLDRWETASAHPILDPYGRPLPNFPAMGATSLNKDVFIEIGYMDTDGLPATYGGVPGGPSAVTKDPHSHLPTPAALKLMGDAFKGKNIKVHFDVGPNYPSSDADEYVIGKNGQDPILARGGERVSESVSVCTPSPDPDTGAPPTVYECQFQYFPGTVGWKTGFQYLRDQLTKNTAPPPPTGEVPFCDRPGSDGPGGLPLVGGTPACERRFDSVRKQSFHYGFFAHFLGLPESVAACLDGTQKYWDDVNGYCAPGQTVNPAFRIPRTTSGIGDFIGGDFVVSMGGFPDLGGLPKGTDFQVASTLMHEFGHNAERRHGGAPFDQNCKPTYFSVMNYLYQLRGLLNNQGKPHLDFSSGGGGFVNEDLLSPVSQPGQLYRAGWYAPLEGSYLEGNAVQPAKRFCNGATLPVSPPESVPEPMVRVDAPVAGTFDWDADGNPATQLYDPQDVNFNGHVDGSEPGFPLMTDVDDWNALRLNQVASRRNVGVRYRIPGTLEFAIGPTSLDIGKAETGKAETGKAETGKAETGKAETGAGDSDFGKAETGKAETGSILGKAETGAGDDGRGDSGGGDLFLNNPFSPFGELDASDPTVKPPPYEFTACVIGVDSGCTGTAAQLHRVRVGFRAEQFVGVASYQVFRVSGTTLTTASDWLQVASITPVANQQIYTTVDTTPPQLEDGQPYLYFARTIFTDNTDSDLSNIVPITGKNDPPVAGGNAYTTLEDTPLVVAAPGVLPSDPDSPEFSVTANLVTPPAHASAFSLSTTGAFNYTPAANYFGSDAFTFKIGSAGTPMTVNLTITAVNDAPSFVKGANQTVAQGVGVQTVANWATAISAGPANESGQTVSFEVTNNSNPTLFATAPAVSATGTLTYTPAANTNGSASITLRITDSGGTANGGVNASAPQVFVITVLGPATFSNVQNAPAVPPKTFKTGSAVPMKWQYKRGTTVVDSSALGHTVTVVGIDFSQTITNVSPGASTFSYSTSTNTWQFNLQTKFGATLAPYPVGTYFVTITPTPGPASAGFIGSPTFTMVLVK